MEARVAVVETKMEAIEKRFDKLEGKLDAVLTTLSEITGGKKTAWAFWSILGLLAGVCATLLAGWWARH
jgi:hypothetical protein